MLENAASCSRIEVGDHCSNMLKAILYMLTTANSEANSQKDSSQHSLVDCFKNKEREPLKEIQSQQETQSKTTFNKRQHLDLCRNFYIPCILKTLSQSLEQSSYPVQKQCMQLMYKITRMVACGIMQACHKGEEYEKISLRYLTNGVFGELLANLHLFIEDTDLEDLIRCLEFCSISNDGMILINQRISEVMQIVNKCFQINRSQAIESVLIVPNINILYPAATILLDLTANEEIIAKVS